MTRVDRNGQKPQMDLQAANLEYQQTAHLQGCLEDDRLNGSTWCHVQADIKYLRYCICMNEKMRCPRLFSKTPIQRCTALYTCALSQAFTARSLISAA